MRVQCIESDSYNRSIRTQTRIAEENDFIYRFQNALMESIPKFSKNGDISSTISGQKLFIAIVEDAIQMIIKSSEKFDIFSSMEDHYGRPIKRYILRDDKDKCRYIFDVYSNLDVYLTLSKIKRKVLEWIPYGFMRIKNKEYIPRIIYRVRMWSTPNISYIIDVCESDINACYTSKMDRARDLVGVPSIYGEKELKIHERVDYEIRRAIFDEVLDVLKSRIDRKHNEASD